MFLFEVARPAPAKFAREEELAKLVERLDKAFTAYGMEISAKTKLMTNNTAASTKRPK